MAEPTDAEVKPLAPAPSEQPVHPLDAMFKVEEADIVKLVEHPSVDAPVAETPAEEPPVAPVKETAPVETPPAEVPPVEAKEKKEAKGPTWRQIRDLQRELKDSKKKNEDLEKQITTRPAPAAAETRGEDEEPLIVDPLTQVTRDTQEIKESLKATNEELARTKALEEQRITTQEIKGEEEVFSKDHPDYSQAVKFLAEKRLAQHEKIGAVDSGAEWEIKNRLEIVERFAEETGRDPKDDDQLYEAAKDMAGRIIINNERLMIVQNCRKTGRSVASSVYDLALDFGFKAPETPAKPAIPPAQERVQRAKEQEVHATSLSAMQSTGSLRDEKITSRKQLLDMDPKEADAYIRKMDQVDPFWDRDLLD